MLVGRLVGGMTSFVCWASTRHYNSSFWSWWNSVMLQFRSGMCPLLCGWGLRYIISYVCWIILLISLFFIFKTLWMGFVIMHGNDFYCWNPVSVLHYFQFGYLSLAPPWSLWGPSCSAFRYVNWPIQREYENSSIYICIKCCVIIVEH